ncbi:hypothetical protein EGK70_005420 [Alcaligenes aquatilis]|uniref:hypothetical protein n=1 Tax=Alcaligenes aquatilis TaxID=323284 RepID=UPI000F68113E|nr:hypothetical protein [Alcaligenes aquatilis]QXR36957.1 hypothetical protein EGK70_005420 [Alcaligenes aquatilis]
MTETERLSQLTRLLNLLTGFDQKEEDIAAISQSVLTASASPAAMGEAYGKHAQNLMEHDPDGALILAISYELDDYLALADTVDELWEEILAAFESQDLPAFPYEDMPFQDVDGFFQWANEQLQEFHPAYCLLEFAQSYDEEFQLIVVKRESLEEILSLCEKLDIPAQPAE